jgi:hypothetical protein
MRLLVLATALVLAGCTAGPARLALPPEPTMIEPRAGAAIPATRQYSEMIVRAFVEGPEGRREVGGATCALSAPAYSASFRTPARVVVPVPATGAPALDIDCRAGALAGSVRRGVVREPLAWDPAWRRSPWGYWDHPYYGPIWDDPWRRPRSSVALGVDLGGPGWDPWRGPIRGGAYYPDAAVTLR